jgi:hypothetical protein
LAEGASIRSIERMTGVNRNAIMSLGLRMGAGCEAIMDTKMVNLPCLNIEVDEIWGFIGKKQKKRVNKDNICLSPPNSWKRQFQTLFFQHFGKQIQKRGK